MISLNQTSSLDCIPKMHTPIRLQINDYLIGDISSDNNTELNNNLQKINVALNKNTDSSELSLDFELCNSSCITAFYNKLKIPSNIKSIELPLLETKYPNKIILSSSITELKLENVADIFKIDFSKNTELQTIVITESNISDITDVEYDEYAKDIIDLLHMSEFQKIRIELYSGIDLDKRHEYEKNVDKALNNVKLPFGCDLLFHYR